MTARGSIGKTGFKLVTNFLRLFADLLLFRDHNPKTAGRGKELEQWNRIRLFVEPLAHRNDQQLVGCARRSLSRWIEAPERFDHVADELQSHGFDVTGGEYVDEAATDR